MPVTLEQGEGWCLIRMEGEVDISSAADLKKLLIDAVASGKELRVDLERATELDVTALQLLWAAEREARGAVVPVTLAGHLPEAISVAVSDAGFEKFPIPVSSN